jgi:hypothetical protein
MSISIYLIRDYNDYKKELCNNITKKIAKACCSIKDSEREKCMGLLNNYKKFCTQYK